MTRIYSCSNSSRTLKLQRAFGWERGVFLAIGGPGDDEALGAVLTPEQALDLARQLDAIAGQPKPESVAVGDDFTGTVVSYNKAPWREHAGDSL